ANVVIAPDNPKATGEAISLPDLSRVSFTIVKVRRPLAENILFSANALTTGEGFSRVPVIRYI
ncbi:MAG: hypothetical protein GWO20_18090, partial [Candidatus Korarchaeota archaeon]|nr:hypothetical protein [Candidatus Korarchaeota archaeon]